MRNIDMHMHMVHHIYAYADAGFFKNLKNQQLSYAYEYPLTGRPIKKTLSEIKVEGKKDKKHFLQ